MSPKIIVNPGTPEAWERELKSGVNRVGRGDDNDFCIPHGSVSGSHCEIILREDGSVLVRDLGSTNGTFIDKARVTEGVLLPGHAFQLGAVSLNLAGGTVRVATPSAPAAPVAMRVATPHAPAPPVAMRVATPAPATAATVAAPPLPPPVPVRTGGLRLSGGATATPPPVAAPVAEAVMPEPEFADVTSHIAIPPGNHFCKFHAKTPARFYCGTCQKFYCDMCVSTRSSPAGTAHTCRTCSGALAPVKVNIQHLAPHEKSFYASIPAAFAYPFQGFGVATLLLATFLIGGDDYLSRLQLNRGPFGWLMRAVVFGFIFLYLQNIIHTTTSDEKETLGFPDAGGFFGAAFTLSMTVLVSFCVLIGLMIAAIFFEVPIPGAAYIGATIIGCVYFPMAFLAVAMKDSVMAANPLVVVPAILKIPAEYAVTTILLLGVYGLRKIGEMLSYAAGGMAFTTRNSSSLGLALVSMVVISFVSVYLLTVSVRILGVLYNRKKAEFGWFSH